MSSIDLSHAVARLTKIDYSSSNAQTSFGFLFSTFSNSEAAIARPNRNDILYVVFSKLSDDTSYFSNEQT